MNRLLAFLLLAAAWAPAWGSAAFDPGYSPVALELDGLRVPYREFAWFVMPNEALAIQPEKGADRSVLSLESEHGQLTGSASGWRWRGSKPGGPYPLRLLKGGDEVMRVNLFVMTPAKGMKDGRLNGYRIDAYPTKPLNGLSIYKRPKGFVEVTKENRDTPVSPHFTLGQFISKQRVDWPHYLLLRPRLLLKLELILETLNDKGVRTDGLEIMSGYRTPFYNRAIGNVPYSRHLWGGAADIFVDVSPADGHMDDLNGDGRIDLEDAERLVELIDERFRREDVEHLAGGLAKYRANAVHGPFVHVDVRGHRARW